MEQYQVTFHPADDRRPAIGVTDAAGKFTMGTNGPNDGAPPGKHKVSIVWVPPEGDSAGQAAIIDDPALLPKPKIVIPARYASPETSGQTVEVPEDGLSDLTIDLP